MIDVFAKILRISNRIWFDRVVLLLFFIISLIQTILSFIVVENELKKFGYVNDCEFNQEKVADYSALAFALLSILFAFFYVPISYLCIGVSFFFTVFIISFQVKSKNKISLAIDGASLLIGLILYAALNKFLQNDTDLVIFITIPVLISSFSISYSFLKKSRQ